MGAAEDGTELMRGVTRSFVRCGGAGAWPPPSSGESKLWRYGGRSGWECRGEFLLCGVGSRRWQAAALRPPDGRGFLPLCRKGRGRVRGETPNARLGVGGQVDGRLGRARSARDRRRPDPVRFPWQMALAPPHWHQRAGLGDSALSFWYELLYTGTTVYQAKCKVQSVQHFCVNNFSSFLVELVLFFLSRFSLYRTIYLRCIRACAVWPLAP